MPALFRPKFVGGARVFRPQYGAATGAALAASATAVASASATLTVSGLAATAIAQAQAQASLTTAISLAAAARAVSSATADLTGGTQPPAAAAFWNYVMANGQTAEQNVLAALAELKTVRKVLVNKTITSPTAGRMTVYDDDGVTVLLQALLYEDEAGTTPYRSQGADRREKLS